MWITLGWGVDYRKRQTSLWWRHYKVNKAAMRLATRKLNEARV